MSDFQDGGQTELRISKELVWGEDPSSPDMFKAERNAGSTDIVNERAKIESQALRPDKQKNKSELGTHSPGVQVNSEMKMGQVLDWKIEGAIGGLLVRDVDISAISVTVVSGTKIVTRLIGDFVADGITVGDRYKLIFATTIADNGYYTIAAVDEFTMTLNEVVATDIAIAENVAIISAKQTGEAGVGKFSYFLESEIFSMPDGSDRITATNGQLVDSFEITAALNEINMVNTNFSAGKKKFDPYASTLAGSVEDQNCDYPKMLFDTASIKKDGVEVSNLTNATMAIARSAEGQGTLGSKYNRSAKHALIVPLISGEALLEDLSWDSIYENETDFEIVLKYSDIEGASGSYYEFTFPSVKLVADPTKTLNAADITTTLSMEATKGCEEESIQTVTVVKNDMIGEF